MVKESLDEIIADLPKEARMKFIAATAKEVANPYLVLEYDTKRALAKLKALKRWFPEAKEYFEKEGNIDSLVGLRCAEEDIKGAVLIYRKRGMLDKGAELAERFGETGLELSLKKARMQDLHSKRSYFMAGQEAKDILRKIKSRRIKGIEEIDLDHVKAQAIEVFVDCVANELPYSFYAQSNGEWNIDVPAEGVNNFLAVRDGIGEVERLGATDKLNKKLVRLGKYGTLAQSAEEREDWDNAWRWYEKAVHLRLWEDTLSKENKLSRAAECAVKAGKPKEAIRLYLLAREYEEAAVVAKDIGEEEEARKLYENAINSALRGEFKSYHLAARIAKDAGFKERVPRLVDKAIEEYVKKGAYHSAATCCEQFSRIDEAVSYFLKDGCFREAARLEKERENHELAEKYIALNKSKYEV